MAEIADNGGGHEKGGKKRPKKGSTRIDMTPMVDLGFLLLTFFVMTTTLSKPKVMSLVYPPKTEEPIKNPPRANNGITFILTKDRIFYYRDEFFGPGNKKGKPVTQLQETTFGPQGIRLLLSDLNSFVLNKIKEIDAKYEAKIIDQKKRSSLINELQKKSEALKVQVKTDDKATCENFIDIFDELEIANIGVMSPMELTVPELELLKAKL